ncbi:MAG: SH3 domain-containing protein [Anaerolineae bacterium]|nr:SH3 domain-containing protein [Anaerolineae bacterium]MDQ7033724.1 SH3 domain-containing protein [Anaerolineae bacterium]
MQGNSDSPNHPIVFYPTIGICVIGESVTEEGQALIPDGDTNDGVSSEGVILTNVASEDGCALRVWVEDELVLETSLQEIGSVFIPVEELRSAFGVRWVRAVTVQVGDEFSGETEDWGPSIEGVPTTPTIYVPPTNTPTPGTPVTPGGGDPPTVEPPTATRWLVFSPRQTVYPDTQTPTSSRGSGDGSPEDLVPVPDADCQQYLDELGNYLDGLIANDGLMLDISIDMVEGNFPGQGGGVSNVVLDAITNALEAGGVSQIDHITDALKDAVLDAALRSWSRGEDAPPDDDSERPDPYKIQVFPDARDDCFNPNPNANGIYSPADCLTGLGRDLIGLNFIVYDGKLTIVVDTEGNSLFDTPDWALLINLDTDRNPNTGDSDPSHDIGVENKIFVFRGQDAEVSVFQTCPCDGRDSVDIPVDRIVVQEHRIVIDTELLELDLGGNILGSVEVIGTLSDGNSWDHFPEAPGFGDFQVDSFFDVFFEIEVEDSVVASYAPPTPASACLISTQRDTNLRAGPGTNFDIADTMSPGDVLNANGQTLGADGFIWWQLVIRAWVRSDVVTVTDSCASIPEVEPCSFNPLSQPAEAIIDTAAFATCP